MQPAEQKLRDKGGTCVPSLLFYRLIFLWQKKSFPDICDISCISTRLVIWCEPFSQASQFSPIYMSVRLILEPKTHLDVVKEFLNHSIWGDDQCWRHWRKIVASLILMFSFDEVLLKDSKHAPPTVVQSNSLTLCVRCRERTQQWRSRRVREQTKIWRHYGIPDWRSL